MSLKLKHVRNVAKNIMKRRILIGLAEHISLIGVVKCGGVVVKERRTNQVVSLENMSLRTTKKILATSLIKMKIRLKRQKNKDVCAANN